MPDLLDSSILEPARKRAGLSRAELARIANVAETTVLRIETGRFCPRLNTWAALIRALPDTRRHPDAI